MTDMLTTDELIEHIRTALGGVGPQQVKCVLKAVGVLAHSERAALARAEAAEQRVAELDGEVAAQGMRDDDEEPNSGFR